MSEDKDDVVMPSAEELLNPREASEAREEGTGHQPENQVSEVEQRAMQRGWTPKEQWKGNPADWRPADVWLDRGEMLGTIQHLRDKLDVTQKQVAEAFKQGQKLAKAKYEDELNLLREMRKDAMREGDVDKIDVLETKIDEVKEKIRAPEPTPSGVNFTPPPEFAIFTQRNPWYNDPGKVRMRYVADGIGMEFMRANPKALPAELYYFV